MGRAERSARRGRQARADDHWIEVECKSRFFTVTAKVPRVRRSDLQFLVASQGAIAPIGLAVEMFAFQATIYLTALLGLTLAIGWGISSLARHLEKKRLPTVLGVAATIATSLMGYNVPPIQRAIILGVASVICLLQEAVSRLQEKTIVRFPQPASGQAVA